VDDIRVGIALELSTLHTLMGADFIRQLKQIVARKEFIPVVGESGIYSVGGETNEDYPNLINAARKAVEHGYKVFLLPNPKDLRTADYIFERKGVYKMFDLKTIVGKNSVGNRLSESIDQTNRVLLNLQTDYSIRRLTSDIRHYFEASTEAQEVLIFKTNKEISIKRNIATSKGFLKMMMNSFR